MIVLSAPCLTPVFWFLAEALWWRSSPAPLMKFVKRTVVYLSWKWMLHTKPKHQQYIHQTKNVTKINIRWKLRYGYDLGSRTPAMVSPWLGWMCNVKLVERSSGFQCERQGRMQSSADWRNYGMLCLFSLYYSSSIRSFCFCEWFIIYAK